MTLEDAPEDERREVIDLLEGRSIIKAAVTASVSETDKRPASQQSVRSLLDIPTRSAPSRDGSKRGSGVGLGHRRRRSSSLKGKHPIRNILEHELSSPSYSRLSSASSSWSAEQEKSAAQSPRKSSDSTDHMGVKNEDEARQTGDKRPFKNSATTGLARVLGHGASASKRASHSQQTEPGKRAPKTVQIKNTVGSLMSGLDLRGLPGFTRDRDAGRGRHTTTTTSSTSATTRDLSVDSIPRARFKRSLSPRLNWLPASSAFSIPSSPRNFLTDNGKAIDMDEAHQHISDANTSSSGGGLAELPKTRQRESSDCSAVSIGSQGDFRLEKDHYDSENNPIESSEEENDSSSSEEEATEASREESSRGRQSSVDVGSPSQDDVKESPKSLLAIAEEEQKTAGAEADAKPQVESWDIRRGPVPLGKPTAKKSTASGSSSVHPRTNFDHSVSTPVTPFGSDDEAELSDIKRAQQLSIQMSAVDHSIPNRAVRTIVRGDFAGVQAEVKEGRRRQRKYLVATDLSEESVYALEWTIGTILRDGDTMYAVFAVHDETSTGREVELSYGEGAKAMQDSTAVVGSQTENITKSSADLAAALPRALFSRLSTGVDSRSSSLDSRGVSRLDSERVRAVESISQTCVRLLRKTLLQVRIAVEVIHCKSPKHMITEAIDGLEPTLVIVGARGRSALKGVLLGSFSNYLVTNSSVPVMVARKKLKKQSKQKNANIRLSNNLTAPKRLIYAKVD